MNPERKYKWREVCIDPDGAVWSTEWASICRHCQQPMGAPKASCIAPAQVGAHCDGCGHIAHLVLVCDVQI
jgi:hypothetical protein